MLCTTTWAKSECGSWFCACHVVICCSALVFPGKQTATSGVHMCVCFCGWAISSAAWDRDWTGWQLRTCCQTLSLGRADTLSEMTQTHKHPVTQNKDTAQKVRFAAAHPVQVLLEHSFVDAARKERCGKVAQIHHLLHHAVLITLSKYHVLFLLIILLGITAVGLWAVTPCLGALSQHFEGF